MSLTSTKSLENLENRELSPLLISWEKGVKEFNSGRYFEAHELWEYGWTKLPLSQKTYIQALIQGCAVLVHLDKRRTDPALRLCRLALAKWRASQSGELIRQQMQIGAQIEIQGFETYFELLGTELSAAPLFDSHAAWLQRAHDLRAVFLSNLP